MSREIITALDGGAGPAIPMRIFLGIPFENLNEDSRSLWTEHVMVLSTAGDIIFVTHTNKYARTRDS